MNIEDMSSEELRKEWQRLYDSEAELSSARKLIDRELGKRLRASNLSEEIERTMAILSPEAKSAIIRGITAEASIAVAPGSVSGGND